MLDVGGYRLAWVCGASLALIATLLAMRIPETASLQGDATDLPLIHRAVLAPGLALFTGLAGTAGFLGFAAVYARDVGMAGQGSSSPCMALS